MRIGLVRHYRVSLISFCAVALLAGRLTFAAGGADPATATVEKVQSTLIDVMKNGEKLGVQGRYTELAPVITETHDFSFVTPRVFGEDWSKLSSPQKETVSDLYRRISIMTFAQQFDSFHGEHFEVVSSAPAADGTQFVRTVMHGPQGNNVAFDYLLRQKDGRWFIVNTVFDGVSGLSMDRARYQPLLQQQGPDALIDQLRKQAAGSD
jgi:phospholipid transport system substrate-binding protein